MDIAVYAIVSGALHIFFFRAAEGMWKRNRVRTGSAAQRPVDAADENSRAEEDAKRFVWLVMGWVVFAYIPTLMSSGYQGDFWRAFLWLTPFTLIYIAEALYLRSLLKAGPAETLAAPSLSTDL